MKKTATILLMCALVQFNASAQLIDFSTLKRDSVTDIDGNIYPTIRFGNTWWMATNLRTKHFNDGSEILQMTKLMDDSDNKNNWAWWSGIARWGYPNLNPSNSDTYGLLYSWNVVGTTGKKVCPEGWKITDTADWWNLGRLIVEEKNIEWMEGTRNTPQGGTETYHEISNIGKVGRFLKTDNGVLWTYAPSISSDCGAASMNIVPTGKLNTSIAGFGQIADYWTGCFVHADSSGMGKRFIEFNYSNHSMSISWNHEANLQCVRCVKVADTTTYRTYISEPDNGEVFVWNGTDPVLSGNRVETGTDLTITASPNTGYKADSISVNGQWYTGSETTVTITGELQVSAAFSRVAYPIIASTLGNGALYIMRGTDTLSSGSKVLYGEKLSFSTMPAYGYKLVSLSINGIKVSPDTLYTVRANLSVAASFGVESYLFTIPEVSHGHVVITHSGDTLHTGDMLEYGSRVTITTVPDQGYQADSIMVNEMKIANGISYTINGASEITASFSLKKLAVTYTSLSSGTLLVMCGNDTISSGSTVLYGSILHFGSQVQPGYYCQSLSVNGIASGIDSLVTVTSATQISARFALQSFPVLFSGPLHGSLTVLKGITPVSSGASFTYGTTIMISVTAGEGYQFDSLTVNNTTYYAGTSVKITDTTVIAAYFNARDYNLDITSQGAGTVIVSRGDDTLANGSTIYYGDSLSITALAGENALLYAFIVNSTDVGTDTSLKVTGSISVSAIFKPVWANIAIAQPQYGELYIVSGSDTLAAGDSLPVGSEIGISALPDAGYSLVSVKINGVAFPVPGTYTIQEDISITASFSQQIYTLDYTVHSDGGTIQVSDVSGLIAAGEQVSGASEITITTSTLTGYMLDSLKLNGELISPGAVITVDGDIFAEAWFSILYYSVLEITPPENGTLAVFNGDEEIALGDSLPYGSVLSIVAQPATGYTLDSIIINNQPAGESYSLPCDITIAASFSPQAYLFLIDVPDNGQISAMNGADTIISGSELFYGTEVSFAAIAATGYQFDSLVVNGVRYDPALPYTITGPVEVSGSFSIQAYSIMVQEPGNGSLFVICGEDTITPGTSLPYGSILSISALPKTGYTLDSIVVNGSIIENNSIYSLTADISVSAYFSIQPFPVGITMAVNGSLTVTANGRELINGVELPYGTKIKITTHPLVGYRTDSVSINGSVFDTSSTYTLTSATDISVHFSVQTFSIIMNDADNGEYFLIADGDTLVSGMSVNYGTQLMYAVEPSEGYRLDSVSINGTAVASNSSYIVTKNTVVSVSFSLKTFTLTVAAIANGRVTITDGTTQYHSGDEVPYGTRLTITLIPAEGCVFDSFTANGKIFDTAQIYTVDGDMLFVGRFVRTTGIDPVQEEPVTIYSVHNTIFVDAPANMNVFVYSISGTTVASVISTGELLSLPVYKSGIYIIAVKGKYVQVAKCLIK